MREGRHSIELKLFRPQIWSHQACPKHATVRASGAVSVTTESRRVYDQLRCRIKINHTQQLSLGYAGAHLGPSDLRVAIYRKADGQHVVVKIHWIVASVMNTRGPMNCDVLPAVRFGS